MPIFEFERDEDGREKLVDVSSDTATFEQKEEDIHVDIITAPSTSSFLHSLSLLRLLELEVPNQPRQYIQIKAPDVLTQNWKYVLPQTDGVPGSHLTTDSVGNLSWSSSSGVLSAGASLTNSLAVWSDITGTLLKDSNIIITNDDEVKDINTLDMVNNLTVSIGDIEATLGDVIGFDLCANNSLKLIDTGSGFNVNLNPPVLVATTDYTLPVAHPTSNLQVLAATTAGVMSWEDSDVAGVDSVSIPSVNERVVLFSGISGTSVKEAGNCTITAGIGGDDINVLDKVNCQRLRLNNDAFSNFIQFEAQAGLSSNHLFVIEPTTTINDGIWKVSSVGNMDVTQQLGISSEGFIGVDSITMQTASNSWTSGGTVTASNGYIVGNSSMGSANITLANGTRLRLGSLNINNNVSLEHHVDGGTYTLNFPQSSPSSNDDFLVGSTGGQLDFKSASTLGIDGDVSAPGGNFANDNRLIRSQSVAPSKDVQQSTVTLDDSGNLTGVTTLNTIDPADIVQAQSSFNLDNAILRTDSAAPNRDIQRSGLTIGDTDIIAGANGVNFTGTDQMLLQTSQASASAIKFNATGMFAGIQLDATDIKITASGSTETSILLQSAGGGIDLEAGSGHTLELDGGQIKMKNKDNTAKAIEFITNQGSSETIEIINTQGTTGVDILLNAVAGGVLINSGEANDSSIKLSPGHASGGVLIESGVSSFVSCNGVNFDTSREITEINKLSFLEIGGAQSITIQASAVVPSNYQIQLPSEKGTSNQILQIGGVVTDLLITDWVDTPLPLGYVYGFNFQYSSATSVDIGTTSQDSKLCIANGTGTLSYSGVTNVPITTSGLGGLSATYTESADQGYDVYAVFDGFTPGSEDFLIIEADDDIELVTEFSGDFTSYRRVGFFYNDGSSNILPFVTQGLGNERTYHYNADRDDLIVLDDGNSATFVDVPCAEFMGLDSRLVILRGVFGDLDAGTVDGATLSLRTNSSTQVIEQTLVTISPGSAMGTGELHDAQVEIMTDTAQIIEYALTTAGDSAFLYVLGFRYSL